VRLELTIPDLQSGALAAWRRARSWSGRRDSNSRSEFGRLACCRLHHFREDSGTPGRTRTRNLDVRSVALFQLSYRSGKGWSIVPDSNRCLSVGNAVSWTNWTNDAKERTLNLCFVLGLLCFDKSSHQRTQSSKNIAQSGFWSGWTESNCRHEFPGLECLLYTTPRFDLVRQVRLELTIPCLRGRCLDPVWLLTRAICDFQLLISDWFVLLAGLTRFELAISASTVQRFDPTKLQPRNLRLLRLSIGNRQSKIKNDFGWVEGS
jgi:hypothetical protein